MSSLIKTSSVVSPTVELSTGPDELIEQAQTAERQGQRDLARMYYEAALRQVDRSSEPSLAAALTRWIGRTYLDDGDLDPALDCFHASRAIAEAGDDLAGVAHAVNLMGILYWHRGDLDGAVDLYQKARKYGDTANDPKLVALVELNLGVVANIRGNFNAALEHYQASLEGFRSVDWEERVAYVLNNLGMLYTDLRRWEEAEQSYREALESCTRSKSPSTQIVVEVNRAELSIAQGVYDRALASCNAAFSLSESTGDVRPLGEMHKHYGVIFRETGELGKAEEHLALAAKIAEDRQDLLLSAEVAREQAELFWRQQRNQETLQCLNRAHRFFTQLRARRDLADIDGRMANLEGMFLEIVHRWGQSIESKDRYTQGHCQRVADHACALARAAGLDEKTLLWFRMGALLHDVGKIAVPTEILNKAGRFTPEERAIMESHPDAGVELLKNIEFPWDIRPMVRHHHEHWDGGGYPARLAGEDIPLAARILCIADVYDALSTDRPYRPAYSRERALEIMEADVGRIFDPGLFPLFKEAVLDLPDDIGDTSDATEMQAAIELWRDAAKGMHPDDTLRVLEKAVENMQLGVTVTDLEGRIVYTNFAEASMRGYRVEELLGRPARILGRSDRSRPLSAEAIDKLEHWTRESVAVSKDGREFPVLLWSDVVRDAEGRGIGIVTCCEDLTARKQAEEVARRNEEYFRFLVETASDLIHVMDTSGIVRYVSRSVRRTLGYRPEELVGKNVVQFVHPEDRPIVEALLGQGPTREFRRALELRARHRDGSWRTLEVRAKARIRDSGAMCLIVNSRDVTEHKSAEEALREVALRDPLTGLPNRILLMERLANAIARAKRREAHQFAILFIDLDRFKIINDSLGHNVGDELLMVIAERLRASLRPEDTIARLGGDEFAILLEGIEESTHAIRIAQRIQKEFAAPVNLSGYDVFTSASIGIAFSSPAYDRPEYLLRSADMAMYRAKASGGSRYEVFDRAMHAEALARLQVETDLRRAIERGEFRLRYQPIVALHTGEITGLEALLRWEHPERGTISPAEFIPIAEETGLMVPIGRWVLRESCRQLKQWQTRFPREASLYVSINLSLKQFCQPDLLEQIEEVLRETGLDPWTLGLEITESVIVDNPEAAARILGQLKAIGVELCMDDFGTGYSSLSYLHHLPLDALKIDHSFVSQMQTDGKHSQLVRAILTLAQGVDVQVIAEGVSTAEQLTELKKLGCASGQGYLFSAPVDAEAVEVLLRTHQDW